MAIDFGNNEAQTAATNGGEKQKKKSMLWLNIGTTITVPNEQGVMEEVVVTLPLGVAVDTMQPEARNTTLSKRKNDLLEKLQKAMLEKLQPGQTNEVLNGLTIFASRVDPTKAALSESDAQAMESIAINFG